MMGLSLTQEGAGKTESRKGGFLRLECNTPQDLLGKVTSLFNREYPYLCSLSPYKIPEEDKKNLLEKLYLGFIFLGSGDANRGYKALEERFFMNGKGNPEIFAEIKKSITPNFRSPFNWHQSFDAILPEPPPNQKSEKNAKDIAAHTYADLIFWGYGDPKKGFEYVDQYYKLFGQSEYSPYQYSPKTFQTGEKKRGEIRREYFEIMEKRLGVDTYDASQCGKDLDDLESVIERFEELTESDRITAVKIYAFMLQKQKERLQTKKDFLLSIIYPFVKHSNSPETMFQHIFALEGTDKKRRGDLALEIYAQLLRWGEDYFLDSNPILGFKRILSILRVFDPNFNKRLTDTHSEGEIINRFMPLILNELNSSLIEWYGGDK